MIVNVTLVVEVLKKSLQLGRLLVVFPFGCSLPGSHVCMDRKRTEYKSIYQHYTKL